VNVSTTQASTALEFDAKHDAMSINFATSATELLVLGVQPKDLTKRLLCLNSEDVMGTTLIYDVHPKKRVIESDGSISTFGSFREWWDAFDAKFPTEADKVSVLERLTCRLRGGDELVFSGTGRMRKQKN